MLFLKEVDTMDEEIAQHLHKLNERFTPVIDDMLEGIEHKAAIIYFSGLVRSLLDEVNDDDFAQVIIKFIEDGVGDDKI